MTWSCSACTYRNLQDGAARCHVCGTARGSAAPAIVDLTNLCSPPPPQGVTGVMESHRRRRRRQGDRRDEAAARATSPDGTAEDGDATVLPRRREEARGDAARRSSESPPGRNSERKSGENGQGPRSSQASSLDVGSSLLPGKSSNGINRVLSRQREKANGGGLRQIHESSVSCGTSQPSTQKSDRGGHSNDGMSARKRRRKENGNGPISSGTLPWDVGGRKGTVEEFDAPRVRPGKGESKPKKRNSGKRTSAAPGFNTYGSQPEEPTPKERKSGKKKSELKKRRRLHHGDLADVKAVAPSVADSQWQRPSFDGDDTSGSDDRSPRDDSRGQVENAGRHVRTVAEGEALVREDGAQLMERARALLRRTFGHEALRPLQAAAVENALVRRASQIVVMATGGGKSLCYQLPALAGGGGVTIVVCPLIALMLDQVGNLHRRGVRTAACLSSSHDARTRQSTLARLRTDAKRGQWKPDDAPIQVLYCTPELIETERFRTVLTKLYEARRLHMFAIDEAHCLSTWGHDFRPAFRKLTWAREAFPDVPFMACTGTATAKVIQDIRTILRFDKDVPCLMGTFNRPNIQYSVRFKESLDATKPQGALSDLVALVKEQHENAEHRPCSGIVYVHKREDCRVLAGHISKATGLVCLPYHAGLKDAERSETQRKWTEGTCPLAVATVAFGMGIDLPHVRYVIRWTLAKSLEGFYQESGRAGRDGLPAVSVLYYSKDDASKFAWLIKKNAENKMKTKQNAKQSGLAAQKVDHSLVELEEMVNYCTKPTCRRKYVLAHFGEKMSANAIDKKTCCDYCLSPQKVAAAIQASECMSAVVNSQRSMHAGMKRQNKGQKYHHNPLADEQSMEDEDASYDDTFGFTDDAEQDIAATGPMRGFEKASAVLKKYETKELAQGAKGGFVTFKARTFDEPTQEDLDTRKQRVVHVPDHLRRGMPDPFQAPKTPSNHATAKGSNAYASESARLKAELAELEKQKQVALALMGGSRRALSSRSSKSLPTPSLSFSRRR